MVEENGEAGSRVFQCEQNVSELGPSKIKWEAVKGLKSALIPV